MTSTRGIRNRNPGNIVVATWTEKQAGYAGPEEGSGKFATFDTMANGVEALMRLLLVYRDEHGLKTVRGIINRWAPPKENDTGAYVQAVSRALGVSPDDELPARAEAYTDLARAIVMHENGRDASAAVTDQDYGDAAVRVFMQPAGATPPATPSSAGVPSPAPAPVPAPAAHSSSEPAMPLPALVAAAASALLPVVADLFRARGSKTAERNANIVEAAAPILLEVARATVPGAANEQAAAEAILASKPLQDQYRAAVALKWSDVAPAFEFDEESRGKAREFADRMTSTGPAWRQIGFGLGLFGLALLIIGGGGWMLYLTLTSGWTTPEMRGNVIAAVISLVSLVVGYFFGSSASSRLKDQTINDQAKR